MSWAVTLGLLAGEVLAALLLFKCGVQHVGQLTACAIQLHQAQRERGEIILRPGFFATHCGTDRFKRAGGPLQIVAQVSRFY